VFVDANLLGQTPHGLSTYTVQDANNNVTKTITVPVYLPSDRRNTSLSSFNTGESVANTWYNSLAVTARRPFANGLEVLMNYTWAKATDDGQVAGVFGTFYGGDTTTDPNNVRFDNGPSDINVKNRMTLSFVYQPQIMEDNKWVKNIVDGFQFSGAEIASSGEPISLGVSGTIYAGNSSSSSYADLSGIFGGAMSSSSGLRSARHKGRTDLRQDLYGVRGRRLQPGKPPDCDRGERHVLDLCGTGEERVPGLHGAGWLDCARLLCAIYRHRALGVWRNFEHKQQQPVYGADIADVSEVVLLSTHFRERGAVASASAPFR